MQKKHKANIFEILQFKFFKPKLISWGYIKTEHLLMFPLPPHWIVLLSNNAVNNLLSLIKKSVRKEQRIWTSGIYYTWSNKIPTVPFPTAKSYLFPTCPTDYVQWGQIKVRCEMASWQQDLPSLWMQTVSNHIHMHLSIRNKEIIAKELWKPSTRSAQLNRWHVDLAHSQQWPRRLHHTAPTQSLL